MAFVSNSLDFPNLTNKATPVSADILLLGDSAAGNSVKECTVGSLPYSPAGGSTAVDVTAATQAMSVNTSYYVDYAGGICTLTLPSAAPFNSFVQIIGGEAASNAFVIAQLASQKIRIVDQTTTTGITGTLTASNKFNSLTLRCNDAAGTGLTWSAVVTMGSFAGA